MRTFDIPGYGPLNFEYLVLDLDGTLLSRGGLIEGVTDRLRVLGQDLQLYLLSDGSAGANELANSLGAKATYALSYDDRAAFVAKLGGNETIAIGNGRNDEQMLRAARIGIAIIGPDGVAAGAWRGADIVCRSITEALDMLLDERVLAATLRW